MLHHTRLDTLARSKHSSLMGPFIRCTENVIRPQGANVISLLEVKLIVVTKEADMEAFISEEVNCTEPSPSVCVPCLPTP